MRILSLTIIVFFVFAFGSFTQMPHGENFKISCDVCHSPNDWKLDKKIYSFDHSKTKMPLVGQHASTDCKLCHPTLVFSEAKTECAQCHNDVHEGTVGPDCNRCHTPNFWLVENTTKIHQQSRFPLVGVHSNVDCYKCHKSETFLRFEVMGTECFQCHNADYVATTEPNHISAKYSTQCEDCHNIFSKEWKGSGFNHNIFPLTQGHAINDCIECHVNGTQSKISSECVTCHQTDYNTTDNPNHKAFNFSTTCEDCHTTSPDWRPARYTEHDAKFFRISSGDHGGLDCTECHSDVNNYKIFSCIDCHEHNKTSMDKEHKGENGYKYDSASCLRCHHRG